MTEERLKGPRARLFVALDLPAEALAGIEDWGRKALADPALRTVPAESLHITLAFLGYRPVREIDRIAEILKAIGKPAPRIELHNPVARPSRGRPRLVALPVHSPATISLQAALQERLVAESLYQPEKRPFWPHLTVARVRPQARGSKRPRRISSPPGPLPQALLQAFDPVRASLYLSELKPQGAKYTPLAQVDLPGAGQQ